MVMLPEFTDKVWPLLMTLYKKAEADKKAKEAAPPATKDEGAADEKADKPEEEKSDAEKVKFLMRGAPNGSVITWNTS